MKQIFDVDGRFYKLQSMWSSCGCLSFTHGMCSDGDSIRVRLFAQVSFSLLMNLVFVMGPTCNQSPQINNLKIIRFFNFLFITFVWAFANF